jgi:predicted DCC family thiol-disulfide oxidoreductase YuxK
MSTDTTTTEFPTLDDRPDAWVVIYDGHCKFCRANIHWISAVDQGKVAYVSLHDPVVQARWPELTHEQLMDHLYLIDGANKYAGAAAFRFLSCKLVALWPLAPLMHIPGSLPVWQFFYDRVARIRYRFGKVEDCENGACHVHFDRTR